MGEIAGIGNVAHRTSLLHASYARLRRNTYSRVVPHQSEGRTMLTIIIIVLLILALGGGGLGYRHYGGAGLGGVLGTVLIIILILWLLGALH
jgi:hypothetical protein